VAAKSGGKLLKASAFSFNMNHYFRASGRSIVINKVFKANWQQLGILVKINQPLYSYLRSF